MTRPTPEEVQARIAHARNLERMAGNVRRRGFHVPPRLEADYQMLRFRHRYTAPEAAAILGITTRPDA